MDSLIKNIFAVCFLTLFRWFHSLCNVTSNSHYQATDAFQNRPWEAVEDCLLYLCGHGVASPVEEEIEQLSLSALSWNWSLVVVVPSWPISTCSLCTSWHTHTLTEPVRKQCVNWKVSHNPSVSPSFLEISGGPKDTQVPPDFLKGGGRGRSDPMRPPPPPASAAYGLMEGACTQITIMALDLEDVPCTVPCVRDFDHHSYNFHLLLLWPVTTFFHLLQ